MGMESLLSMDEVLRKCYQGKLKHRETDLVETLPSPYRADQLALTSSTSVSPVAEGLLASAGESPLAPQPISIVAPSSASCSGHTEIVEDSKDSIISNAPRVIAKRKVDLAMGEASTGAFNIGRRIQSRRNFARVMNSISSTSEAIVVIPNDDIQQFEGDPG